MMEPFFGIIAIGRIYNELPPVSGTTDTGTVFIPLTERNIRFVHYPDCQQLIIWLTHPGREYEKLRLINNAHKKILEEWLVADKLSGSIQLLWDTLPIPPGSYTIEIAHHSGGQHQVNLEKFEEGIIPPVTEQDTTGNEEGEKSTGPIQYRDGFGNLIVEEDLVLREKVLKDLNRKFFRHLEYEGNFRSGTIIYIDNEVRIQFNHEMGGGNCMLYIDIPTEDQWEAATKTALKDRKEILEFVAARVQAQQASNCNYVIKENAIAYYYK